MIPKDLVGATSRPLVLSIIARGDAYGYAILQRMQDLSGGEIEWKDGFLYPVLHRLEDEGLITSEWITADSGRRRKYYSITPVGRRALQSEKEQWLRVDAILARLWGLEPRVAM